jgi:flagellar basal-body rod protein FlgC
MDFSSTMTTAASGMRVQGERMRLISENIANASSTGKNPGEDPYRRQVLSFEQEVDRATGALVVRAGDVKRDPSDFRLQYNPGHPAANESGYVQMPNVNTLIEMMDMREAQRTYEANLNVIDGARQMFARTLDLLRRG